MKQEWIDSLLFDAPLTPEQRAAFDAALQDDPALQQAVAQWTSVQQALRVRLQRCLADPHVLVLYALDTCGYSSCLSAEERNMLVAARAELKEALAHHPALEDIIRDIQQAATDFDAIWSERTTPARPPQARRDRPAHRPGQRRSALRWTWRITAVVVVVAFTFVLTQVVQRENNLLTVETVAGEARLVVLPDSSYVRLLENTRLSYANPQKVRFNRRVSLEGNAFFDVEPTAQPFIVETRTALTTVLGTRFGIESSNDLTEVVLESGNVTFASRAAPSQPVILESGQMSRAAQAALPTTPVDINLGEALQDTGVFYFDNMPLADVLAQLGEHFDVALSATDDLITEAITGPFYPYHQPLSEILETLALTLRADVEPQGDGYHLAAQ